MTSATVFVDDAVLGNLPPVCVKTGHPTPDHLTVTTGVGASEGLGLAWLLVLLGPVGWLGLGVYAATRRSEVLSVRLPYSEDEFTLFKRIRRDRRVLGVTTVVLFVLALAALTTDVVGGSLTASVLALAALGVLCLFVAESWRASHLLVRVRLDASRRWVTLVGVHPKFAAAVTTQNPARLD